ncbi:HAD family hydrolase [Nocardia farcinica]|uniref:HAD family hydrolase n=1 Tax=Nocardia farcinica TaxID=37329 RepID=UPI003419840A
MVALDIDGTICPPDSYRDPNGHRLISEPVRKTVATAVGRGVKVVLCTGRTVAATIPFLDELNIGTGRAVCSNGAVIVDADSRQVLNCNQFHLAEPVRILRERIIDAIFVAEVPGVGILATDETSDSDTHFGPVQLVRLDEIADAASTRLAVHWPGRTANELSTVLSDLRIPGVRCWIDPAETFADLTADDVSKASAAESIRVDFGVAVDNTMAIGDGLNDLELLRWAGLGVAMGQAPLRVQNAADMVCAAFEDDGVASALNEWLGV